MKNILIFTLLLMLSFSIKSEAQKKSKKAEAETTQVAPETSNGDTDDYQFHRNIFVKSMKYYDYGVATMSLYHMIELKPEKTELMDTLALLYFNQGGHAQCKLVGEEILAKSPDKVTIREIVAISEQSLGMYKDALEEYEKIFAQTKDVFHLYQIATLQYTLKRFGECNASIAGILQNPEANEKKININTGGEVAQNVPISAAALNMQGVIALEMNKSEEALSSFNKALEIFPEFSLAKANIEKLSEDSK